jgi:hypothetical protein
MSGFSASGSEIEHFFLGFLPFILSDNDYDAHFGQICLKSCFKFAVTGLFKTCLRGWGGGGGGVICFTLTVYIEGIVLTPTGSFA